MTGCVRKSVKIVGFDALVNALKKGDLITWCVAAVDAEKKIVVFQECPLVEAPDDEEKKAASAQPLDTKVCVRCAEFVIGAVDEEKGRVGGTCSKHRWETNGLNTCQDWKDKV